MEIQPSEFKALMKLYYAAQRLVERFNSLESGEIEEISKEHFNYLAIEVEKINKEFGW